MGSRSKILSKGCYQVIPTKIVKFADGSRVPYGKLIADKKKAEDPTPLTLSDGDKVYIEHKIIRHK